MKRVILTLLLLCSVLGVEAAKQTRRALLFTPEMVKTAKERIKSDAMYAEAWNQLREKADKVATGNNVRELEYLAVAYLMTGEKKYADAARDIMLRAVEAKSWGVEEMMARRPAWRSELQMAHRSFSISVAYDAIYKHMTPAERKKIAQGMYRLAIEPMWGDWLNEPTRIHALNSMGHNWWTSCTCMAGMLALSMRDELPELREQTQYMTDVLPEWFCFEGDVLQRKPKTMDADGGMYESLNYANFGVQEALLYLLAWRNIYPESPAEQIPHLKLLPDYFLSVCYPRTGMLYNLNFGDSHKNVSAESSLMLLYALGIQSDDMLWYFKQVEGGQHRDGYFLNRPMGFMFMPDLSKAPAEPAMPKAKLFADFGWATMRTSWQKDATMLAVKSGFTWNHAHADANSFILYHKGIDIIKDAGNSWYAHPAYRGYFFQSEAHNVVLFNGKGQSRKQQYQGSPQRGYLHHLLDGGSMRYVLADGTGPYSDNLSRNFRHFFWMDDVIFIIDDLQAHEAGEWQWLWHPGGEAKKRGYDLHITNGESAVAVRPLFPRPLAQSDFVHDYPEDMWWEQIEALEESVKKNETYYSFHLPGVFERVKGLTAIYLKDSPKEGFAPKIERLEGKNYIGIRMHHEGKITDLYINQLADGRLMHMNSWIEVDGWTTDAYMFAVRYDEGSEAADADEMFVCYGSALRRGEKSYFSSLSKLFVISRLDDDKQEVVIDGQSRINARLGCDKRPAKLVVNGKATTPKVESKQLLIRCEARGKKLGY